MSTPYSKPVLRHNQPNEDNIVKLGIHGPGYTHIPVASAGPPISTPRTVASHDKDGLRIPKEMVQELRCNLAKFYPELAKEPFASTRLCWSVSRCCMYQSSRPILIKCMQVL